jgi:glyoxylase-like metal-dependent hydrolase (beta-lactamase superfamily II)
VLTEVAEGVWVHQSPLLENNTVAVRGDTGVLLVDAGITSAEMSCLADDLRRLGLPVVAGFSTHPDWDHVLWHPGLGEASRYGTARCAAVLRELRADPDWASRVADGLPPEIAGEVPLDLFGLVSGLPEGSDRIPWDGPRVRVVEHPAHSPGHAALVVEAPGGAVLVAGDMLSDVLVPMLDEPASSPDPVADYLLGLDVLESLTDGVEVVVPGHGSVGGAQDLRTRLDLDRAYVVALREGTTPDDPRIGPSARPGWEWVSDLHAGQVRALAAPARAAPHRR